MNVPDLVQTGPRPARAAGAAAGPDQAPGAEKGGTPGDFEALVGLGAEPAEPRAPAADATAAPPPPPIGRPMPDAAEAVAEPDEEPAPEAEEAEATAAGEPEIFARAAQAAVPAASTGGMTSAMAPQAVSDATTGTGSPLAETPQRTAAPSGRGPDVATVSPSAAPAPLAASPGDTSVPAPLPPPAEGTGARQDGIGGEALNPTPPADVASRPDTARTNSLPAPTEPTIPHTSPAVVAATSEAVASPAQGGPDWRLGGDPAPHPVRAGAEPQPAVPTVSPQALADQITLAVGRTKDRSIEIRLDPPELGRVQIQLTHTETGLHAVVLAERPETHDLLRRHAELLARDLGGAGFNDVSLDFAAGGQAAPGRDEARFAAGTDPAAPAPREPVTSLVLPHGIAAGGLDIRL